MLIGSHVSAAGGVQKSPALAVRTDCECFQIFTKSQLKWDSTPFQSDQIIQWFEAWEQSGYLPCFVHDSYLINLSSPDEAHRKKSIDAFVDELERAALLSIPWVNTHPGSHKGSGEQVGLDACADSLRQVIARTKDLSVGVLLETTAGQGNDLGSRFDQLGYLLKQVGTPEKIGICFDTCHAFAAGYDLRTAIDYERTWTLFDEHVGLDRLKAFHLNDSKFPLNSHKDRHAEIGKGELGVDGFKRLMQDRRFKNLPGACELPDEDGETTRSIAILKKLRGSADS